MEKKQYKQALTIWERVLELAPGDAQAEQQQVLALQAIEASTPLGTLLATLSGHSSTVLGVA